MKGHSMVRAEGMMELEKMKKRKRGTGITFRSIVDKLSARMVSDYREILGVFVKRGRGRGNMATRDRDMALAGFEDGARAMLCHLEAMGVLVVRDDTEEKG